MKTYLTSVFFLFSLCLPAHANDDRVSFVQGGFKYFVETDSTVCISDAGLEIPLPVSADSTLVTPSSVCHEGKTYQVKYIEPESFGLRLEIKCLIISEGVEQIGRRAFNGCLNLADISIPSTLEYWGEALFEYCSNLRRITVSDQNEDLDSRDDCNAIIETDKNTLIFGCTGTKIPASVTTIGQYAFRQCCQHLEQIVVPEGVKRIERWAFSHCINLKEISLPASLESMGYGMFNDCMSLESVTIPRNVSEIRVDRWGTHWNLFAGCYNLKEVKVDRQNRTFDSRKNCNAIIDSKTDVLVAGCGSSFIPEGVKAIDEFAFEGTSIPAIRIPKSVRKIGSGAFLGCRSLSAISVAPGNPIYDSRGDCNAIIETASARLLHGCSRTVIPNDTKEIADSAFYMVYYLPPHLVIPEGVEVIGQDAFSDTKLNSVQLPSTLKRIKRDAFACCKQLYYVDMSRCSPQVGFFAFYGCETLNYVNLPSTPGEIDETAFCKTPFEALWKKEMKQHE
ncbi:MAG: leucine-rich repeat domain-containing protein [Bacteroidaceae bacterium]|nr:leucine-rich repeat domain-containing protein [Bacteroidaceae bacterium]